MPVWLLLLTTLAAGEPEPWPAGGALYVPNAHPLAAMWLDTRPLDAGLPQKATFDWHLYQQNTWSYNSAFVGYPAGWNFVRTRGPGEGRRELDTNALTAQVQATPPADGIFLADTESTRLQFNYTQPFGRHWGLQVEVPIWGYQGGAFDQIIETFHSTFNYGSANRQASSQNRTCIYYARGNEVRVYKGPFEPAVGDIVLRGIHAPLEETPEHPAVALSAAVKLPTAPADRFLGSGTLDYNVALSVRRTWGNYRLYTTIGHTWVGGWAGLPQTPVRNTWDLLVGGSWKFSKSWTLDAQISRSTHALAYALPDTFGKPSMTIGGRIRHTCSDSLTLAGGFFENINENNNTYDAGLSCEVIWTP